MKAKLGNNKAAQAQLCQADFRTSSSLRRGPDSP